MNYYEILEISPNASQEVISHAYRALAKKHHPDKYTDNIDKENAENVMKKINEAYETLNDKEKRKEYDSFLKLNADGYDDIKSINKQKFASYLTKISRFFNRPVKIASLWLLLCIILFRGQLSPTGYIIFIGIYFISIFIYKPKS